MRELKTEDGLKDMEAAADLMIQTGQRMKLLAQEARLKLTGSSLPVVHQGIFTEEQVNAIISRRMKTIANRKTRRTA